MANSLKLFIGASDRKEVADSGQTYGDHLPQQSTLQGRKIKIDDSEKFPSEQQKFPSFHEVLGPALTGFRHPASFPSGKLIPKLIFSWSVFRKFISRGNFRS